MPVALIRTSVREISVASNSPHDCPAAAMFARSIVPAHFPPAFSAQLMLSESHFTVVWENEELDPEGEPLATMMKPWLAISVR